ncbi:hypothetical protein CKA32_000688 [Geitlerinema sp. FC II]|nr:hypothetical protein CKA32_000688 [Geitlerinema sp. FC II]
MGFSTKRHGRVLKRVVVQFQSLEGIFGFFNPFTVNHGIE